MWHIQFRAPSSIFVRVITLLKASFSVEQKIFIVSSTRAFFFKQKNCHTKIARANGLNQCSRTNFFRGGGLS